MKFKFDAFPHHITLNDINMCFITETWINTDHNLPTSQDLDTKSSINTEESDQEEM